MLLYIFYVLFTFLNTLVSFNTHWPGAIDNRAAELVIIVIGAALVVMVAGNGIH